MTTKRQREAMSRAYETERQATIREFGLTGEEIARTKTCEPGDPVSDYAGNFAVQAAMIADERNGDGSGTAEIETTPGTTPEAPATLDRP